MDPRRLKSDKLRFKYINKYLKGSEILDIGATEGYVHGLLKEANPDKKFYNLDNDGDSDFKVNLDKPGKLKKKFDTVIAGEVIEHMKSPIEFVKFCKSILKRDGRLILTTPNATGLQYLLDPSWCVYYKNYRGHTQAFTKDMLKRILLDEGIKVTDFYYINAFWIKSPMQYVSWAIKRLRPDLMMVGESSN